jgi:hypothetical protein
MKRINPASPRQLDILNKGTTATSSSSHLKILTFQEETKKFGCLALQLG